MSLVTLLTEFRKRVDLRPKGETAKRLRVATDLLERFLRSNNAAEHETFSEAFLRDFTSYLIINNYSKSTILYNLKLLRILTDELAAEGIVMSAGEEFKPLIDQLKAIPANLFARTPDPEICGKFRKYLSGRLLTGDDNEISLRKDITLYDKLFIFSVLNGGGYGEGPISLKKEDPLLDTPIVTLIAESLAGCRRKYLFPLGQSDKTPKQQATAYREEFEKGVRHADIIPFGSPEEMAAEIWLRIAYEIGTSPSVLKACFGEKARFYPALAIAPDVEIPQTQCEGIRLAVADNLTDRRTEWYAFRIRKGVVYSRVEARLKAYKDEFLLPDVYYPCKEIAARIGDNLVLRQQPIISGLLFIKCRYIDVVNIVRRAGDILWCYVERSGSALRYAVIPPVQMYAYRKAIASILPETEVTPIGETPLREGDKVEIIGGDFHGRVGTFQQVSPTRNAKSTGRILYRLLLPGGGGFEWPVDLPANLLRQISSTQFTTRQQELSALFSNAR